MRLVKLSVLAAMALLALSALGTALASAEDGSPEILCLVAKCAEGLEAKGTGKEDLKLVELAGGIITATTASATIKNCEPLATGEGKDTNLCKNEVIDLTGVESKKAKCNSPGDEPGVILLKGDLHLAAEEETATKTLEPLGLARILNEKEEFAAVALKCSGGLTIEVKGTIGCLLLPGLEQIAAGGKVELLCKVNEKTFDPETGKCELLCEWLEKFPFEAKLGAAFRDAWLLAHLEGTVNKDIFVDD